MTLQQDSLYKIFEQHLLNLSVEPDSIESFILQVTEDYMETICQVGFVPLNLEEVIREDVSLEVRDMLRVKTYGFFSLKEFRNSESFKKLGK